MELSISDIFYEIFSTLNKNLKDLVEHKIRITEYWCFAWKTTTLDNVKMIKKHIFINGKNCLDGKKDKLPEKPYCITIGDSKTQ